MALKDLVAQKSALTEAAIEEIVSDYVRYDLDEHEIIFTPKVTTLSNKAKILIFLVAQQGWQFVSDEASALDAKPAVLEEILRIPGGTLRPTLKDLKDRHLLVSKSGSYSVRATSLDAIKAELSGSTSAVKPKPKKVQKTKSASDSQSDTEQEEAPKNQEPESKKGKKSSGSRNGASEKFSLWIKDGLFDEERTLSYVQKKFHEVGIIIPQTSISGRLLNAIRAGDLARTKKKVGGKEIWVYRTEKK